MEKGSTVGSNKKKLDDSIATEKDGAVSDGVESKKEQNAEKLAVEKEEGGSKNDGVSKKDRTSNTTPKAPLRSTRSSNNPEFVAKQRHFLQKVNQGVFYQSSEEEGDSVVTNGSPSHSSKRKRSVSGGPLNVESSSSAKSSTNADSGTGSSNCHSPSPSTVSGSKATVLPKKRKSEVEGLLRDVYCWVCHREIGGTVGGSTLACEVCPRVYHARCCHSMDSSSPRATSPNPSIVSTSSRKGWACPECVKIVRAETMGTRSRAMQLISMDQLCTLLKHVLVRVRTVTGAEPFFGPVDLQQFPRYREYVANPMDLGLIDRNIRRRTYGSTEAFFADMKWVVHNSIIFNTQHSKLTSIARSMIKICRQELMEIENCPDCYTNAHTRKDNWFIEVCRRPHILVWAKLKGFPHWPAKAMRINKEGCVDVRFFGAHDRAWVPAKDCFLYSEEMPAPPKNRKKNNLDGCIMEVEDHIKKLREKFGVFVYAPFRTTFDPSQEDQIIVKMLPRYQPLNLEGSRNRQGKSSPERQISRESPSISAGTEEESEEDHSLDGDEQVTSKRLFDSTFEDSMEVPSGCDVSLSEAAPTSHQPPADAEKETAARESGSGEKEKMEKKVEVKDESDKDEKKEEAAKELVDDVKESVEKEEGGESSDANEEKAGVEPPVGESGKEAEAKVGAEDEGRETKEKDGKKASDTSGKEARKPEEMEVAEDEEKCPSRDADDVENDEEKEAVSSESKEEDAVKIMQEEKSEEEDEGEEKALKISKPSTEDKDESRTSSSPSLDKQENSVGSFADDVVKIGKEEKGNEEVIKPDFNKGKEEDDEGAADKGASKDDIDRSGVWDDMPVDDDVRLSAGINRESLSDTLAKCELGIQDSIDLPKEDETSNKSSKASENRTKSESSPSENVEQSVISKDADENDGEKSGEGSKLSEDSTTEMCGAEDVNEKETSSTDDGKSEVKGNANEAVAESDKSYDSSDIREKIDVNKLRVSLMTKCANISISANEASQSPGLTMPKTDTVLANALHPETGALITPADEGGEKSVVDEETPKVGLAVGDGVTKDNQSKAENLVSNKGDVGSQLSILGKLQQRLSFVKENMSDDEEVREKEDENVADESESAIGDASCSSSSDNEEEDEAGKEAAKDSDKVAQKTSKKDAEAEKEESKTSEENLASAEDETAAKDETLPKEDEKVLKEDEETKETESEEKVSESEETVVENEEVAKENTVTDDKDEKETNVDESVEKAGEIAKESVAKDDEPVSQTSKTDDGDKEKPHSSDASEKTEGEREEIAIKEKTVVEKVNEDSSNGQKATKSKVKASESKISDADGPVSPKKPKLSEVKDNDAGLIQVKSKVSLMKVKTEEVVEEEVLNREVLKESNMVVVQKTVKTRRFEEDGAAAAAPVSAPKRARKGVAHKAVIVDRSDSPSQDELFPSMFLDPSVTITVLQEAEKENGDSKEPATNPPSVEELRTSVNLSNDVSLTMVRPSVPLEGLAAAQDLALSRNSDQNQVDIVGVPTQSLPPTATPQFRPRARKSFPRPSPRITARSPQSLTQNPSSMEVKRIPISINGRDMPSVNMNAGPSQGRTLPSGSSSMSVRVMTAQPPVPITSLAFSSSPTFSTASTSQPLVHSMVSQVLPSSSVMVTSSQGGSPSTSSVRLPHLHPRPPHAPFSGPQPLYVPSEAGPLSAEFSKHAHKLAGYMRVAIEEILGDLSRMGNSDAALKLLRLEVEKMRWDHQQEIAELKHNQDLVIMEMRNSLEKDKMRCVNEVRRHCETEKLRAIEETKRKQWCANCSKEALFYCCWNTSYCDYPCQQAHWPRHMSSCAQNNGMAESGDSESGSSGIRKDGNSSGHKGMPGAADAPPPPPFHQLHRPGGAPQQESLPEEEYYDEDSNSPSTPRMGTSGGTYRVKRRRCGSCKGCLVKNNCGSCAPCRNSKTHQVCRMRRCRSLQSDWVPMPASGSGTPSRPISPEPAPLTVSLKTPPLTYASKRKRGSSKSPRLSSSSSVPANMLASTSYSMQLQQHNGESSNMEVIAATADANDSQIIPYGGSLASQSRQHPPSQSPQQASAMELPSQPIGPPMIHPHILSQAMNPYIFPLPFSQSVPPSQQTHPNSEFPGSFSQQSNSHPQQPYSHPQQPHSFPQQSPFPSQRGHSHAQQPHSHAHAPNSHHQPGHPHVQQPHVHSERPPYPSLTLPHAQQRPHSRSHSHSQPPQPPPQNSQPHPLPNPNLPPPLRKSHNLHPPNSAPQSSYMQNPYLYPAYSQNPLLSTPYGQGSNPHPPNPPPNASKSRSRNQSNSRSRSPQVNNRHPSPQPPVLNQPYAILSSTSILMPPPPNPPNPHQFFFPNSCDISPASMTEQHQIHRQRMAAGVDLFTESMRIASRPSYFV